ncbi:MULTISPECIES: VOC family protein [Flavobacteriaceae]|uniref:VOC family protein n=1 Tax=Flavobacteriaceae TaxID=49546 RepID=UPI00149269F5|nr:MULTISPECIES: VOC family protein [Allomuricauda]MDC6364461.1 VOC family protein [Muricauda sp. AC10]
MKQYLVFLCLVVCASSKAQLNKLDIFDNLVGKTWEAEGEWGDGSKFKQEITFQYSLDSTLIIADSKGFTNKEQTNYGPRNHGIRKLDPQTNSIKFWEFDIFGGTTEGSVKSKDKDIIYSYAYGESTITDYWAYVDDHTYDFTVGAYKDGAWEQTYLKTQFREVIPNFDFQFDHYSVVVTKLQETGDFYRDIFGLKEIQHPDRKPGFRWFQVKGNSQIHLIEKDVIEFKKDKSIHWCLATQNLNGFIQHLVANNIDYFDWPGTKSAVTDRSDGVKQIYIQDPEGYWIEINTVKH